MRTDAWHCAGWSRELARGPIGRRLLGRDVVLFRDASGAPCALGARCPHRGADLARGAVVDGCIQCPFHGWRFDGRGQCVRVPSQPERVKVPPLAHVPSYPLRDRQGTLWIWMQAAVPPGCEPPTDRVAEQARTARVRFEPRLMDAPFLDVLENVFDKAHLPFIHAGSFGRDQDPLVARQRVTVDADERGLSAEDEPGAPWRAESKLPRGAVGLVARLLLGLRAPVAQRTRFDVAEGVQLSIEYPAGTYDRFVTRITPADDGHTWLFVESIRTRAPHALGDWVQRRAIGRLFAEGERETALLLRPDSGEPLTPVSVESDRVGLAARRLYERWAGDAARARGDRPRRTAS